MRYSLVCAETINATPPKVWAVWSDVTAYPTWDDREEAAESDGPSAPGVRYRQHDGRSGTYVITAVDPGRSWTTEEKVPRGFLRAEHDIVAIGDSETAVRRSYQVAGLTSLPFASSWRPASGARWRAPSSPWSARSPAGALTRAVRNLVPIPSPA